jgi:hypothetical protein
MNIKSGIKLLDECEGTGLVAERGDWITYNIRAFLSRGDEIPMNTMSATDRESILAHHPEILSQVDGYEFINFNARLGKREACAGVEYSLYGMREGGYRKVKVSPHLAYGETGIPDQVPANAVIVFDIWLRKIRYKAQQIPGGDSSTREDAGLGTPPE